MSSQVANEPSFQQSQHSAFSRLPCKRPRPNEREEEEDEKPSLVLGDLNHDELLLCCFALQEATSSKHTVAEHGRSAVQGALSMAYDSALRMVLDARNVGKRRSSRMTRAELTDHELASHLLQSLISSNPHIAREESAVARGLLREVQAARDTYHNSVEDVRRAREQLKHEQRKDFECSSDLQQLRTSWNRQQAQWSEVTDRMLERWELLCLFVKSKVVRVMFEALAQVAHPLHLT